MWLVSLSRYMSTRGLYLFLFGSMVSRPGALLVTHMPPAHAMGAGRQGGEV